MGQGSRLDFLNTRKFRKSTVMTKCNTVGLSNTLRFLNPYKREANINVSKLIYPSVSLLQSGDISNDKAESKRYLGCEKSLMVSFSP